MGNASEIKDMLTGNLLAGAVLGALLAGLFACHAIAPENNAEFFQSAARDGLPLWAANAIFAASLALMCTVPFGFGLFLPLGRSVIKRARDRMLSGWLVGCLAMLGVQLAYAAAVLALGSAVGLVYFAYCLVRLRAMRRAEAGKRGLS